MKFLKNIFYFLFSSPVIFSAASVLTVFANNIKELLLKRLFMPIVSAVIFGLFSLLIGNLIFRNRVKAQVFSAIFIILFFSYESIHSAFAWPHFSIWKINIKEGYILFLISIFLLIFLFFYLKKSQIKFYLLNKFLLLTAFFFLLISSFRIIRYELLQRIHTPIMSQLNITQLSQNVIKQDNPPDIYYLVPEDYSSPQVLKDYFNYDSNNFLDFLNKNGFYIASQSSSNYPKTFLSLASSLNMDYLDYLSKYKNSSDQTIVNPLIEQNNTVKFLQSLGYGFYQMGSWWEPTNYNHLADDNFNLERKNLINIDDFSRIVINSTMLRPFIEKLLQKITVSDSDKTKKERILYQFGLLPQIIEKPGPKFIFMHIIAPHGPYVFESNCESLNRKERDGLTEEQNYINQANCINQKLETAINQILNLSKNPPVILLQSDEGAPFLNWQIKPDDNWKTAGTNLLKEKFPIFSAFYLPGKKRVNLYPSISPVNSFRLIFSLYFKANLPLLPDKNYIFSDLNHLYDFKDVTEQVKN